MPNPQFQVEVYNAEFEKALIRFQEQTRLGWPQVLRMQARLLVQRLIEWTPPFGSDKAAQRKGQAAVARDVRKVTDFHGFQFRDLSIQKAWETNDKDALNRIFRSSPHLERFRLLEKPVAQIHQNVRRNGRVPKHYEPRFVVMDGGRRSGDGKIAAYIRSVNRRVGKAKAGWIAGARLLASRFPAWIAKSGGEPTGSARDLTQQERDPSITLSNHVPYACACISFKVRGRCFETISRNSLGLARCGPFLTGKEDSVDFMGCIILSELSRFVNPWVIQSPLGRKRLDDPRRFFKAACQKLPLHPF